MVWRFVRLVGEWAGRGSRYSGHVTQIEELSINPEPTTPRNAGSGGTSDGGDRRDRGSRSDDGRRRHDRRYQGHRRRYVLRDAWLVLVAVLLSAVIVTGVYAAVSAALVARELRSAAATVSDIRDFDVTEDGAVAKLDATARDFRQHVNAAYLHTSNPVWAALAHVPRYGGDVQAVRSTVGALHTLANDALPLMADAANDINPDTISMADGTISVPGLDNAAPKLAKANAAVLRANNEMQSADGATLGMLQRQIEPVKEQFLTLASASDGMARAAQLLPSMLGTGSNGGATPRNYLVLAQNNAEIRSTGGIAGSFGLMTVTGGKVELHEFVSNTDFREFDAPVVALTDDERQLYGDRLGEFMQDVNFTPDFARAAQIAKAMWESRYGGTVDGVIGMDPVMLQTLLKVTGPVTVTQGSYTATLDGDNATSTLLNGVYASLGDPKEQDEFFSNASKVAFDKILHSSGADPVALGKAAMEAARNGHFQVWSANADEQKLLAGTEVGGTLVTKKSGPYLGIDGAAPQQVIGVYYNDAMASKMDWFLDRKVEDKLVETYADGSEKHEVTITMRNMLDASQVDALPGYVVGTLENGAVKGNIQFINYLYAPAGGGIPDYKAGPNGEKGDVYALHDGLTVIAKQISLAPGETYQVKATVVTAPNAVSGKTVVRETAHAR